MTRFKLLGTLALLSMLSLAQMSAHGSEGRELQAPPRSAACLTDQGPSDCGEPMWIRNHPAAGDTAACSRGACFLETFERQPSNTSSFFGRPAFKAIRPWHLIIREKTGASAVQITCVPCLNARRSPTSIAARRAPPWSIAETKFRAPSTCIGTKLSS
jgi:hypothetical protein